VFVLKKIEGPQKNRRYQMCVRHNLDMQEKMFILQKRIICMQYILF